MDPIITSKKRHTNWLFAASVLLALVAAAPLFFDPGFLNTRGAGESPYLLVRTHQMVTMLAQGEFPVRWMPDAAYGLGYPFFSYYAAFPYYLAAGFKLFGLSYVVSIKLTIALGFVIAAAGMFGWMWSTTRSQWTAILASAVYTFAPYHLVNVYVRGDMLSEFWAMAWLPMLLMSLHLAAKQTSLRRVAFAGAAFGLLVMTHNVSALIFTPFVALYALGTGLTIKDNPLPRWRILVGLLGAGLLGIGLSAWVWLPALVEQGAVQLAEQTSGFFHYGAHFRGTDLLQRSFVFNYNIDGASTTPFSISGIQAILIGFGIVALIIRLLRERSWWHDIYVLIGLITAIFMVTPQSEAIWANVPLLPLAQFPWRFLSLVALFGAAVAGALPTGIESIVPGKKATARAVAASVLVLASSSLWRLPLRFISINDADVTAERIRWYEVYSGDIGTTIRHEYLPVWAMPRPYTSEEVMGQEARAKFLNGAGTAARLEVNGSHQKWQVDVDTESAEIAFPVLYWPGWQARVDGVRTNLMPVDSLGYMQVVAFQGEHIVELHLGRTGIRWAADLIALAAVIVLAGLWRPRFPQLDWLEWAFVGGGLLTLVVISLILNSLPAKELEGILVADFDTAPYFHHINMDSDNAAETDLAPPPPVAMQQAPTINWDRMSDATPGIYFPEIKIPVEIDGVQYANPHGAPNYIVPVAGGMDIEGVDFGFAELTDHLAHSEDEALYLHLVWHAKKEAVANYLINVRITDNAGNEWVEVDTQAGSSGLYATGLWRPGDVIHDTYRIELPHGTPPGAYIAEIALYEMNTLETVGYAELTVRYEGRSFRSCEAEYQIRLLDVLGVDRLRRSEIVSDGGLLHPTLELAVLDDLTTPYHLLWTLVGEDGSQWMIETPISASKDTLIWEDVPECGLSVVSRPAIPLPEDLPSGTYNIKLQLINLNGERAGAEIPAREFVYRRREFEVPRLANPNGVDFGRELKLWGYTFTHEDDTLMVDVAWGAQQTPSTDYKIFVHVYNPETGEIVAQTDVMPLENTYPTSQWVENEVVAEQIQIDLSEVPAGTYTVGLGWYDSETEVRLPAVDQDGNRWPDDRVILEEEIIIP